MKKIVKFGLCLYHKQAIGYWNSREREYMSNINILATAITNYTHGVQVPVEIKRTYTDSKGAKHEITFSKPDEVKALFATDSLTAIMRAGDVKLCVLFAKIASLGIPQRLKYKYAWQYIEAQYGFAKATANTYINIGENMFVDGVEKFEGISNYTIGQLIPMVSVVTNYPYIEDIRMDNKMFEFIVAHCFNPSMKVSDISSMLKVIKNGYLPKEWVHEEVTEDGTIYQLQGMPEGLGERALANDWTWHTCPYLKEVDNNSDNGDNGEQSEQSEQSEEESVTPLETIRALCATIDGMKLDKETAKEWKLSRDNFLATLEKIFG